MSKNFKYYISRVLNRRLCSIKNSIIDSKAVVGNGAQIVNSTIGRYSYVFESELIYTDMGAFCSIASDCVIGGGAHPTEWVSTSPVFYKGKNVLKRNFTDLYFNEYKRTYIGNDVWIGSKCLIKAGVKIGNGAIIGMGSVVTHDVPEYEIWAGNPAKLIRKRFPDEIIEKLKKIKWWDFAEGDLEKYGQLFDNPEELIKRLEER